MTLSQGIVPHEEGEPWTVAIFIHRGLAAVMRKVCLKIMLLSFAQ
jgi:hypothetical protein